MNLEEDQDVALVDRMHGRAAGTYPPPPPRLLPQEGEERNKICILSGA